MQSPRWSGTKHLQDVPEPSRNFHNLADPWRGWANLIASGALTPGLLSALMLAAGFTALAPAPALAAPATLASAEAGAPVVSIQRPTHADQLRGTEQIQISIKSGRYPAQSLEMYVDNRMATPGAVPLDASMLPVAVFNWDTKVFADGPHRLSVIVTDSQGFKSRSDVQIYINNKGENDIVPPLVRWKNVRHGAIIQGDFPVEVEATDNFGVKWVIISLNRAISPALKPPLRAVMVNTPPYILHLRKDLPADQYVLSASAWDAKDNRGDAPPLSIIIQPNVIPGLGQRFIPPVDSGSGFNIDNQGTEGPSGEATKIDDRTILGGRPDDVKPAAPVFDPLQPRLTMPFEDKIAGDTGLMAPGSDEVTARAEPGKRGQRVARLDAAAPRPEEREMPVAPPTLTALHIARGEVQGRIAADELPAGRTQRTASNVKPNLALRPQLDPRLVPGQSAVTQAPRSVEPTAPALATLPVKTGAPRSATFNPAQPQGESRTAPRVAAQTTPAPAAAPLSSAPQLARTTPTGTTITQLFAPTLRAGSQGTPLASLPAGNSGSVNAATMRLVKVSPPTITPLSATDSNIARPFPSMKDRPVLGPSLAVLPQGVAQYPQIPSPNLSLSAIPGSVIAIPATPHVVSSKSASALPALPPSLPRTVAAVKNAPVAKAVPAKVAPAKATSAKATPAKTAPPKIALNPAMPKTGEQRPLAAITVAPQSQWGAVAETLPASHTVRRDETLSSVARRYQMPVAVLAAANNLKNDAKLRLGAELALPRALRVTYAGHPVPADAPSFTMGSVGVTPFRFLFEKQGGKLEWDAKTRRVTARGAQSNVSITVGSRTAVVNQKEVLMDLAAFLMSGRTMVPLRFMEEAMQARVDWDPATGRIYVAMANPSDS